jgi:hypothetical protein
MQSQQDWISSCIQSCTNQQPGRIAASASVQAASHDKIAFLDLTFVCKLSHQSSNIHAITAQNTCTHNYPPDLSGLRVLWQLPQPPALHSFLRLLPLQQLEMCWTADP